MHALFTLQNWRELFNEDSFSLVAALLILGPTALSALLFSDHIQRWRAENAEQKKWLHWNRR